MWFVLLSSLSEWNRKWMNERGGGGRGVNRRVKPPTPPPPPAQRRDHSELRWDMIPLSSRGWISGEAGME